ncbi:hypothetical protein Tco_0335845 [Tanacetum coccineum]
MMYKFRRGDGVSSWVHMDYARALIDIKADRELKEYMVISIPNMEDHEEVLHTVRVEYEWEPPRCVVSKMNSASSSGTKKNSELSRKVMIPTNHFDALTTIKEGGELGSNRGLSNSGKKVVQDVTGSASGSPSNTHLVARINDFSSNVVCKKVDDLVNEDSDNEVEEIYNETATYMASTSFNVNKAFKSGSGGGNKSLYKQWKETSGVDPYDDDDFDDPGLTYAQMKFANAFDINLHGQHR